MKFGDVFWVVFEGAVETKRRPMVIVSSDIYHASRPDVIVGLLTTQLRSASGPTDHVLLDWQEAGLSEPTAFRAFLGTRRKGELRSPIGRLSARDLAGVENRVRAAILSGAQ